MRARLQRAMALALVFGAVAAQTSAESGQFSVSFGGIRAGILAYDGAESGGRYKVNGAARASGLLGALFDASVDSTAQGAVAGNRYAPAAAREITREGDKSVERSIRYSGGIPAITRSPARRKPQKHAAPASAQKGTVDTTTAAFAILRDRPADLACRLDLTIYDGAKRHRIRLDQPEPTASGLTCRGTYTRVAGFSPEEMAEQVVWPLRMSYRRQPDGTLRVTDLSFRTSFGKAQIRRR